MSNLSNSSKILEILVSNMIVSMSVDPDPSMGGVDDDGNNIYDHDDVVEVRGGETLK